MLRWQCFLKQFNSSVICGSLNKRTLCCSFNESFLVDDSLVLHNTYFLTVIPRVSLDQLYASQAPRTLSNTYQRIWTLAVLEI
ncbi:hypothetical protein FGO68_gene15754 [Halteria grandinella]|uniref:Uncharacterized protein n=1 Tax=Halteria grandinella TaxID=5974 RepID=A0A8J8NW10_HALGN|nr:hypothetical protein FGO68_gene15754 [Halteria grandinella]